MGAEEVKLIKERLEEMAIKLGPAAIYTATVIEINADDTIKVVLDNGLEIDDVRLKAVVKSGNKIILEPEEGSEVLIGSIENSKEYVVLAVDEIRRMYVKIGDVEFEAEEKFLLKKGEDSLKQVVQLIIESVQQIMVVYGNNPDYTKLSQALTKLNNLMN